MINRFNNLTSKEWLPFQKSWFRYTDDETLYRENIRFFIKFDDPEKSANLFFYGDDNQIKIIKKLQKELKFKLLLRSDLERIDDLQFAIIDLRTFIPKNSDLDSYLKKKKEILDISYFIKDKLQYRRFLSVFSYNLYNSDNYYPIAWDLAKTLSSTYSLKDEKIACLSTDNGKNNSDYFSTSENTFYSLYLRSDEKSNNERNYIDFPLFSNNKQKKKQNLFKENFQSWFILKPKPRKKNEVLHPAKYPEELTRMFIKTFTKENDNVFDPMSGTGSTQLSALQQNRNAYGTELSEFFADISNQRCSEYIENNSSKLEYKILNKDARNITKKDFPKIDYIITSPPYWDMLNMKGAENQAKRIKKGLQTNYSDNNDDLGNVADYKEFLNELTNIYYNLIDLMKSGSYITIVVKNIKKKGSNYPFAWDLTQKLQKKLILLPEVFWLQDDISIAPYGYFNTYVSNTFHQYCLTFQKP